MICTKCNHDLMPDAFTVRASGRVERQCKECKNAYLRADRLKRGDVIRAQQRERNKKTYEQRRQKFHDWVSDPANAQLHRERSREDYRKHREARKAASRRWHSANKDRVKVQREANRDKLRAQQALRSRRWFERNREKVSAAERAYNSRNPVAKRERVRRRRARLRGATVERVDYQKIIERFGMCCHICGHVIERSDLEFDHVIPLAAGGAHSYENVRPSHARCNRSKGARLIEGSAAA